MVIRIWPLMALIFLAPPLALAAPPVEITGGQGRYPLGLYMDLLEDREGNLGLEEVMRPPAANGFMPHTRETPNMGFSKSAFWFRATALNSTTSPQPMILQQFSAWIDEMDFYVIRGDGATEHTRAGEKYPFDQRAIINPHFLFPLELNPGETVRIFFRAKTEDPIQLPLTLWKKKSFDVHNLGLTQYFGVIFGCLLTIFFYNLFLFFSLKDKNYLYYVAYIAAVLFMIFTYTGNSYQYFWPQAPRFQSWVVFPTGFLAMFLGIFFTKGFLDTRRALPRAHRFLTAFQAFCVAAPAAGSIIGGAFTSFTCVAAAMVFPLVQAVVGAMAYVKRVRAARYFVLAWSFSMVGIFYTMITVMGLYSSSTLSRRSMELGLVIDAILLSFALADRIKLLRRDKETAEARASAALSAANEQLETRVALRTEELKTAKEKAEEATALKDKFVNLVSHDLRAPIGAIIGLLRGAIDNPAMEPVKKDDFMRRSVGAAERLMGLIDHLLNISRLRTGKLVPMKSAFAARNAVYEVVANLERLAQEKEIWIDAAIPADFILVADRGLAKAVFHNITSNAIKFLPRGGKVSIHADPADPAALVFTDNGPGVPEAFLPNLFRVEIKTSSPGTEGERGSGLGLPYCWEIMETHGGSIRVELREGGGSVFIVSFPVLPRLVLLVDDQEAQRSMIKSAILKGGGAAFIEADDGLEALEALKLAKPFLIVTDVNMPGMGGLEFLERLKASATLKDIPVIVASAVDGSPDEEARLRQRAMRLGAADFVTKPIAEEDFARRVWRLWAPTEG